MAFDYESKTAHWVNRLSFLIRAEVVKLFRQHGYRLTAEEWAMLMLLWGRPPRAMTELAEHSLRDRTTLTRLIDQMVKKDLLTRQHDPKDRRRMLIGLSDKGQTLEAPLTQLVGQFLGEATKGIAEKDVATTNAVLRQMEANLLALGKED